MYGIASQKFVKGEQTEENRAIKVFHNKNVFTPTTQLQKELKYLLVKSIEKKNS